MEGKGKFIFQLFKINFTCYLHRNSLYQIFVWWFVNEGIYGIEC